MGNLSGYECNACGREWNTFYEESCAGIPEIFIQFGGITYFYYYCLFYSLLFWPIWRLFIIAKMKVLCADISTLLDTSSSELHVACMDFSWSESYLTSDGVSSLTNMKYMRILQILERGGIHKVCTQTLSHSNTLIREFRHSHKLYHGFAQYRRQQEIDIERINKVSAIT